MLTELKYVIEALVCDKDYSLNKRHGLYLTLQSKGIMGVVQSTYCVLPASYLDWSVGSKYIYQHSAHKNVFKRTISIYRQTFFSSANKQTALPTRTSEKTSADWSHDITLLTRKEQNQTVEVVSMY